MYASHMMQCVGTSISGTRCSIVEVHHDRNLCCLHRDQRNCQRSGCFNTVNDLCHDFSGNYCWMHHQLEVISQLRSKIISLELRNQQLAQDLAFSEKFNVKVNIKTRFQMMMKILARALHDICTGT